MGSVFSTISSAVKTVWSGIKNVAERAYNFVSNVTTSISYVTHNAIQKATNFVTAKIGGCAITVVKAISLVSETIIQGVIGNFALVIFAASFLILSVYILSSTIYGLFKNNNNNNNKNNPLKNEQKKETVTVVAPTYSNSPNYDRDIKKKSFDHTDKFLMDINSYINNLEANFDINTTKGYYYTFDQNGKGVSKIDKNKDDDLDDLEFDSDDDNNNKVNKDDNNKNDKDDNDINDDENKIGDKQDKDFDKNEIQEEREEKDDNANIKENGKNNIQNKLEKDDDNVNIKENDKNNIQNKLEKDDDNANMKENDKNNIQNKLEKDDDNANINNQFRENEYVKNNVMTSFVTIEKVESLYEINFTNSVSNLECGKKIIKNIENRLKYLFEDDYKIVYIVQNENGDNEEKEKLEDIKIENIENIELITIDIAKKIIN